MSKIDYKIRKTKKIKGVINNYGAKNLATKLIITSLLSYKNIILRKIPLIGEINIVLKMLGKLKVKTRKIDQTLLVQTAIIGRRRIIYKRVKTNRTPILILSILISRMNKGYVPKMMGDKIGKRNIDYHIAAIRKYGINFYNTKYEYIASVNYKIFDTIINLPYPSVGTTENCILLGVYALGTTIIQNIAIEIEILEIIFMLRKMGAIIIAKKQRTIIIHGIKKLRGIVFSIIKDRVEAASWACINYAAKGEILMSVSKELIKNFLIYIEKREVYRYKSKIICISKNIIRNKKIETGVFPCFSTDFQQLICKILIKGKGISIIHETVYEKRLKYKKILMRLGIKVKMIKYCIGKIKCRSELKNTKHTMLIYNKEFNSTKIKLGAYDIRGGFASIILSIIVQIQKISGGIHIERGYGNIISKVKTTNMPAYRKNVKRIV